MARIELLQTDRATRTVRRRETICGVEDDHGATGSPWGLGDIRHNPPPRRSAIVVGRARRKEQSLSGTRTCFAVEEKGLTRRVSHRSLGGPPPRRDRAPSSPQAWRHEVA